MAYFEFPHTRNYDSDLGWLIVHVKDLLDCCENMTVWKASHEQEYNILAEKVEGLINNLVDVIVPWDSSIAYHIFSIVEYQGTNYIAIQDVPVGTMITNTAYWQPANTALEQINAIGVTVDSLKEYPYVNVKFHGAKGDGVTDDTQAVKDSIQYAVDNNINTVYFPIGTYIVNDALTIPFNMCILGDSQRDSVIKYNFTVTQDVDTFLTIGDSYNYGSWYTIIKNIRFECAEPYKNCIKSYSGFNLDGVTIRYADCAVSKAVNSYMDMIKLDRCYFGNCLPTTYVMQLQGNSDALYINQLKVESDDNANRTIYISACHGGTVENCILGDVVLYNCTAITFRSCHQETYAAKWYINRSTATIENCYKWKNTTVVDFHVHGDRAQESFVIIKDCSIMMQPQSDTNTSVMSDTFSVDNYSYIDFKGTRMYYNTGLLGTANKVIAFPKVTISNDDILLTEKMGYSPECYNMGSATAANLTVTSANFLISNTLANGTYNYVFFLAPSKSKGRYFRRSSSTDITLDGQAKRFVLGNFTLAEGYLHIYRGQGGSFTDYVCIPYKGKEVIDNGALANGYAYASGSYDSEVSNWSVCNHYQNFVDSEVYDG